MPPPDDLVAPKEAARLVGVGVSSVYRWIENGTLKAYQIAGVRYRVSRRDVLALVQEVEVPEPVRTTSEDEDAAAAAVARMEARRKKRKGP